MYGIPSGSVPRATLRLFSGLLFVMINRFPTVAAPAFRTTMDATSQDHRECARCRKSHCTPNAYLLRCRVCRKWWHHSTCAIPVITVGDLLKRMQRTNARESTQTIWDWECLGCQRGASAAEPIELDDEEIDEFLPTSSSRQTISIDLTADVEEESVAQEAKNTQTPDREPSNRLSITTEDTDVGAFVTSLASSRSPHPREDAASSAAKVLRRMSIDEDRQVLSGGEVEPQYASQLGPSSSRAAARTTPSLRPPSDFAANLTTHSYSQRPNYHVHPRSSDLPRSFPIQENWEKDDVQEKGQPYPRLPQFFDFAPEFPSGDGGTRNSDSNRADGNPWRAFKRKARRTDPDLTGCEVIFMARARRKGLINSFNDMVSRD